MSQLSDCSPKEALLKGKKMITISILIYCLSPPQFVPSGNEGGKERGLTKIIVGALWLGLEHDLQVPFYLQLKKLYGPVIKIVGSGV